MAQLQVLCIPIKTKAALATPVNLGSDEARTLIQAYASEAAAYFRPKWPVNLEHEFSLTEAKKLLAKKDEENPAEE